MIPSEIVQGVTTVKNKYLKTIFGSYSQAYLGTTNTTRSITVGAIALQKYNKQGGYFLY